VWRQKARQRLAFGDDEAALLRRRLPPPSWVPAGVRALSTGTIRRRGSRQGHPERTEDLWVVIGSSARRANGNRTLTRLDTGESRCLAANSVSASSAAASGTVSSSCHSGS